MARMETGGGGGPHWHGLSYGYNNPWMDVGSEQLAQDVGPVDSGGEGDAGQEALNRLVADSGTRMVAFLQTMSLWVI